MEDGSHSMLKDDGVYSSLLRAALDNQLKGVVMGPNCRTRSNFEALSARCSGGDQNY